MALRMENKRVVWSTATEIYPIHVAVLALSVAVVCYLAARLGDVLLVPPLQTAALWPANAVLASVLLLVPRSTWPVLTFRAVVSDAMSCDHEGQGHVQVLMDDLWISAGGCWTA